MEAKFISNRSQTQRVISRRMEKMYQKIQKYSELEQPGH